MNRRLIESIIARALSSRKPNTERLYARAWNLWTEWLQGPVEAASSDDALRFLEELGGRQGMMPRRGGPDLLAGRTLRSYKAGCRFVYRCLQAQGAVTRNPFADPTLPYIPAAKNEKRVTEAIDFDRVSLMLGSPSRFTKEGIRDGALMAVWFGGGCRISETLQLKLFDVQVSPSGTFFLYLRETKRGVPREQVVPGWAAEYITRLVSQRKAEGAQNDSYLFVPYRGPERGAQVALEYALPVSSAFRAFKLHAARCGLKNVSPHSGRATAITKLLDDGVPHREVAAFSGHSTVQMVEVYDKRRFGLDRNPGKKLSY